MSNSERRQQPLVSYSDDDSSDEERHKVIKSKIKPLFSVGQQVRIKGERDGPYKVAVVALSSAGTSHEYTLCDVQTSASANNGAAYSESQLEAA